MPHNGPQTIFGGRFRYQPSRTSGLFTDSDFQAIIGYFIEQGSILNSHSAIYTVMFHGNLTACWWNCPHCPQDCGGAAGYHSYFANPPNSNTLLKYSILGDPTTSIPINRGAIPFPEGVTTYPNDDPASACMSTTYMHEVIGIITNPTGKNDIV